MGRYNYLFGVLILLLSNLSMALQSYRATYEISVRGVSAGEASYEAIFTDRTYRLDTKAHPSLAAMMLGYGEIVESAQGELHDGVVIPQKYERSMDGDADFRLQYDYQAQAHTINAQVGSDTHTLTYAADINPLDVLALIVQCLSDESHGVIGEQYTLLSDENIRTYEVSVLPDEIWKTAEGENINVSVYAQTNGARETKIYFADNPLRLVRLTQYKNGDARFSLRLLTYHQL